MPELPDVEGFKRVLAKNVLCKTIARVVVSDARILGKISARTFASRLQNAKLVAARRRGKHLMANIDHAGWLTLHPGMTGALKFVQSCDDEPPFTRVRLDFASDGCPAYTNKRMIGRVGLVEDAADFIAAEKLGPDALDRRFDFDAFKTAGLGIRRDVKSVLMDQQFLAEIGNIFSDEILFQARVNPAERTDNLAPSQLKRLFLQCARSSRRRLSVAQAQNSSSSECPRAPFCPNAKREGIAPAADRS